MSQVKMNGNKRTILRSESMGRYQEMKCKNCKHYEMWHQHPNPNAVSQHWCKKCGAEIEYCKVSPLSDNYMVWLPKKCYFNNYFEESEEYKEWCDTRYRTYEGGLACQVED